MKCRQIYRTDPALRVLERKLVALRAKTQGPGRGSYFRPEKPRRWLHVDVVHVHIVGVRASSEAGVSDAASVVADSYCRHGRWNREKFAKPRSRRSQKQSAPLNIGRDG